MLRPRRGFALRLILALGILVSLMGLSIWLNFSAGATLKQVRDSVYATAAIVFANDDLFSLLQDLESGQRGYLLTRRPAYLDSYYEAAGKVGPAMQKLHAATDWYPRYSALIGEIDRLVPVKIKEMTRTIDLAGQGDWETAVIVVESDIGKNTMNAIRDVSNRIEQLSIADRMRTLEEAESIQTRLRFSSIAIGAIALIGALLAIFNLVTINLGLNREVVRRREVEIGLLEHEQRNRAFFENSGDFLYIVERQPDDTWRYAQINPAMERLFGKTEAEVKKMSLEEIIGVGPALTSSANYRRCMESRAAVRFTNRANFAGGPVDFDVSIVPLVDEDGEIRRLLGSARDITQARLTEAALRQSQKMQAVGQLTGGVAHDFNNLLQVMIGYLELATKTIDDPRVKERLNAALAAGEMGRDLTRRLLAFARQAPTVARVIDLRRAMTDLEPIIRASLGETIAVELLIDEGLWNIEVDRASLDNAILNLAINARDAMPKGGTLKIEVSNVTIGEAFAASHADAHAGDHVRIVVSDTGAGIAPELLDKIFVPFFTTKAAGKGTGLGLPTVYAMVRDRGGFIDIASREGLGTSVALYFPRSEGIAADSQPPAPATGGSESILLVEDDRQLLDSTAETLRGLGYTVEASPSAEAALEMLAAGRGFDLLFTDVVMPGRLNGVALATRAQGMRPGLRILFMSGYIDDPAVRDAAASGNMQVLQKPFRSDQLAAAIRAALERSDGARRAGATRFGAGRLDFRPAATGRSVLVVEDDALVRAVAVDALTIAGFRCIEAESAAEALACLQDTAFGIDAMVTDLRLPDQSGEVVVREATALRPAMPVIVSTGTTGSTMDPALQTRAGVSFLYKPYAPELLVRRIVDVTR